MYTCPYIYIYVYIQHIQKNKIRHIYVSGINTIHIPSLSEKTKQSPFQTLSDVSVLRRKGKFTALWLLSGGSESPSIDEKFGLVFGARKNYNKFNHKYKDQTKMRRKIQG